MVLTMKVVEDDPPGMVTVVGVMVMALSDLTVTTAPFGGACPFRVIVPVDGDPA